MNLVNICCFKATGRDKHETTLGAVDEYGYNQEFARGKFEELREDFGGRSNTKVELCRMVRLNGEQVGVELALHKVPGQEGIFIFSVAKNSAAEKAGLHVGDQLLEMNKKSLFGRSNHVAAQLFLQESRNSKASLIVMRCKDWKTRMNTVALRFDAADQIVPDQAMGVENPAAEQSTEAATGTGTGTATQPNSGAAPERSGGLGLRRVWPNIRRKANAKDALDAIASSNEPGIEVKKFELTETDFTGPFSERMI